MPVDLTVLIISVTFKFTLLDMYQSYIYLGKIAEMHFNSHLKKYIRKYKGKLNYIGLQHNLSEKLLKVTLFHLHHNVILSSAHIKYFSDTS